MKNVIAYTQRSAGNCDYSNSKYFELDITKDGEIIGGIGLFVSYDEDGEEDNAFVKDIGIDEEYQNRGYGTEVLKNLAREHGGIYICPDNPDAERLYRRLGEEIDYSHVPKNLTSELDEYGVMYYID